MYCLRFIVFVAATLDICDELSQDSTGYSALMADSVHVYEIGLTLEIYTLVMPF